MNKVWEEVIWLGHGTICQMHCTQPHLLVITSASATSLLGMTSLATISHCLLHSSFPSLSSNIQPSTPVHMLRSWLKGTEEGENLSVSISILRNNVHCLLLTFPKLGTWDHPYPKKRSSLSFCMKKKQQQQQKSIPTKMCLVTGNFYVEVGWVTRNNSVHCLAISSGRLEDSFLRAPGLI